MRALLPILALLLACRPFADAPPRGHGGPDARARQEPQPTPRPVPGFPAPPPPPSRGGPRPIEFWYLEAVTRDGSLALLRNTPPHGSAAAPRLRLVDVDRGAVLEELALEQLARLPRETVSDGGRVLRTVDSALRSTELAAELASMAKLVERFPLGAIDRFAAAPGGRRLAFNAGDWIYVADGQGRGPRRVAARASYGPWFTPDGKRLVFRRIGPSLDGVVSRYDLYSAPADLGAEPRRIDGTGETREPFVLSADGREAIMLAGHPPQIPTCALAVPLAPPHKVRRLACLEGGERQVGHRLSPTGRLVEVVTSRETSEDDPSSVRIDRDGVRRPNKKLAYRLRVLSLADGKVVLDMPHRPMIVLALSDEGLLLRRQNDGSLLLMDAVTREERVLPRSQVPDVGVQARFRGPREILYVQEGLVKRLQLP
jgi:hypothetical protein